MKRVILASNSPRRRELLARMDIPFTAKGVQTEEFINTSLPLGKAIEEIARQKALAVKESFPEDIIVGADTIVCIDGEVLGKPRDKQQAFEMLKRLSGRTHQVLPGLQFCIHRKKSPFISTLMSHFIRFMMMKFGNILIPMNRWIRLVPMEFREKVLF